MGSPWKEGEIRLEVDKTIFTPRRNFLLAITKLSDHRSTKSLLANLDMSSVNQLNAQIKITEIWKTVHKDNYPIEVKKYILEADERILRSKISDKLLVKGHSDLMKSSYKNDAIKLWNNCPDSITKCTSVYSAKKAIKTFVKNFPI